MGKPSAMNALARAANLGVWVFTDARQALAPGAVPALVSKMLLGTHQIGTQNSQTNHCCWQRRHDRRMASWLGRMTLLTTQPHQR